MKKPARPIRFLFVLLHASAFAGPAAVVMPAIPDSGRILTLENVKNFWANSLLLSPLPPEPGGLHPAGKLEWNALVERRRTLFYEIKAGSRNIEARLAQLTHNAHTHRQLGRTAEALVVQLEYQSLAEHVARLEVLEAERQTALAQAEAARAVQRIEAEIACLRSQCTQSCQAR